MIFSTTAFGAIYGCIVGLVWALALNLLIKSGMTYGSIIGGSLALLFALEQKRTEIKVKRELREMTKSFGNLFFMLFIIGVATGLIAWIIRFIFFKH